MTALALDIGGTKFAAATVGSDGRPVDPRTEPTPTSDVWPTCQRLLTDVVSAAGLQSSDISTIGIGAAGPVDSVAGTVGPINIAEWYDGFPIVEAVSEMFPSADITLALDGACIALAEQRFGAARGAPNLIGMTVSTGIGGGLILGGDIVRGAGGNAGHIGHVVVPGSAEPCTCGGVGCLETVASGPNAVRWAKDQGWEGADGIALSRSAAEGDAVAVAALQRAGTAIGQVLAGTAALLDIPLAVLGGGFAQAGPALWDPIHSAVAAHAGLSFLADFTVVPAQLGGFGTLAGAAALTAQ